MPFGDDKNKELLTGIGLTGAGVFGTGTSIAADSFINKNRKMMSDWDARTKELWNTKPFKSSITGDWLQVSPEMADKLLDNYVDTAHALSSQKVGPWRAGNIVGSIRTLPAKLRNILGAQIPNIDGTELHYDMFSDPNANKGALKAHMLDIAKDYEFFDGNQKAKMKKDLAALPKDIRNLIEKDPRSITEKYKVLSDMPDKAGVSYLEKYVLGKGVEPGVAKLVGGGILGKINPKTGAITEEVIHPGYAKNYTGIIKPKLKLLSALNKARLGAGLVGTGVGLFGLGKTLHDMNSSPLDFLNKSASYNLDDETLAKLLGGGALTGIAGTGGAKKLQQFLHDLKAAPNLNVGFNYGELEGIGDGHKAPAKHIRQVLERYIESLPDGHELKGTVLKDADGNILKNELGFAKRQGGVQFIDMANRNHGVAPGVANDFNIIYNTGLGAAIPLPWHEVGNTSYGEHNARALKGKAQSIRNYVTDTPKYAEHIPGIPVPDFGAAVGPQYAPDLNNIPFAPAGQARGHGYHGAEAKTLGYGAVPESAVKIHNLTPFYNGSFVNLAPEIAGTPFISPDALDSMNKYVTKEQKLNRLQEIVNSTDDAAIKGKLQRFIDAAKAGKRIVTVAGSGRGDYVAGKTAHLLDSINRKGLDNVEVVPLAGKYTGAEGLTNAERAKLVNAIERMDSGKNRVNAFGRLDNEAYTLLQQISDINLASTGQMALSESANAGNLQYFADDWRDMPGEQFENMKKYQTNFWSDALGANTPEERARLAEVFSKSTPQLQAWNGGSIKQLPKTHEDTFKTFTHYGDTNAPVREGVADILRGIGISDDTIKMSPHKFDMDPVVDLLLEENRGKFNELSAKAFDAAAKNRALAGDAHKALAEEMVGTLKKNVRKQKIKALPGVLGNALGTGLGVYGMVDGVRNMLKPTNFNFNLNL